MDVQTENTDPPPGESQPSGKIRKGFKLFGKRKPGNIFSIRSKGDGNNKSPVIRSKTLEGLSETPAPDSEQESDKEKGQEVSQGEREQAEEEALGEDGVLAAATARTSISSTSSAKSLGFLSLLRGGRRGVGDRRVHTVSQPVGRQRRGLKGLFGNVKFKSKDKEEKEEAPPSPLLMSSRANSVEIIKEDLPLTPKSQPRSLDSPETESYEPLKSLTSPDSAATSLSETITPQVTTGTVSKSNEHEPPSPKSEPPLVPGDNSLSSLLADISSLLTFDSITGGGDIMADVEAEWGKASSSISAVTEVTPSSTSLFSKPTISPTLTSTAKPSPVAVPTAASPQSFTSLTKTTATSSPISKPSTIITSLTKTSTLTTHSVKVSSYSTPASDTSTSTEMKSTPAPTATKPSTTPVTLTSLSPPVMSFPSTTIKSTLSSTSTTTTAPPNTPATVVKGPSVSPVLTSTASKLLASEAAAPPQVIAPVSKPSPVTISPSPSAKPPTVTHSPPIPVTQSPPSKLDSVTSSNLQTSTSFKPSLSSAVGESKAAVTVSPACTVSTKPSSPAPVVLSKTAPTSTSTSGSVSVALSIPTPDSTPINLSKTPPSLVTAPDICPSLALTATTKTQPSPASVPTPSSTSLDKLPPTTKPPSAPVSVDKMPPAPTPIPAPTTHTAAASSAPTALAQIPVSQSKTPPVPAQVPLSLSKDLPAPVQIPVSQPKAPPAPAQLPVSLSMDPRAPICMPVSASKDLPASAQIPVFESKTHPAPTTAPCPVTSPPSTPAPWSSEAPGSKTRASGLASVDRQMASANSTGAQEAQVVPSKTEELHSETQTSLQGPSKEKRIPQVKASGLSKIPVVGGGRVAKPPVRDGQQADDEPSRDLPTPVLEEERPHFNSHDAGSKDKVSAVEVHVPTSKHVQEESQQPQQQKVNTNVARDSKIPVKHGAQPHAASPQTKETPRTKIPVSRVPVRRVGNKPTATGASAQMRK